MADRARFRPLTTCDMYDAGRDDQEDYCYLREGIKHCVIDIINRFDYVVVIAKSLKLPIHAKSFNQCLRMCNVDDQLKLHAQILNKYHCVYRYVFVSYYRPYAYDVTERRPRALGVKRGTLTCAIAKHAASGPTPACHTAGPARVRAPTESQRLFQHSTCAQHDKSWPQHGVVVMEMWRQCIRSITFIETRIISEWTISKPA